MHDKCNQIAAASNSFLAGKFLINSLSFYRTFKWVIIMAAIRSWQSHYTFFDDLESITAWKPPPALSRDLLVVPLNSHRQQYIERPLILHCHDLDNGYNEHKHDIISYNFTHWTHIDTFIYFSHHTLTIPPPHWINAAHRNGVDCLATLITEWERGERLNRQMLNDTITMHAYADQLVAICQYYGFDGYLVNIEAKLTDQTQRSPDEKKPDNDTSSAVQNTTTHNESAHRISSLPPDVSDAESRVSRNGTDYTLRMVEFLDYLTKRLHDAVPGARVIWYDSVSAINGQLRWQSVLNKHNIPFFNVVDALFTDYHWKADMPAISSKNAGKRHRDVYTGIDLFGRGTYGGGGHNAHFAMDVITAARTSIALFAPSWTFEGTGAALISRDKFEEEENKLWIGTTLPVSTITSQYTAIDQKYRYQKCIGEYAQPRLFSLLSLLPYHCDFNSGYGHRYYENGICVRQHAWYDMNVQTIQVPLTDEIRRGVIKKLAMLPDADVIVSMTLEYKQDGSVWNGGSSLRIDCNLPPIKCPPFAQINIELPIFRFTAETSIADESSLTFNVDCVYQYSLTDSIPIDMKLVLALMTDDRSLLDIPLPAESVEGKWSRLTRNVTLPHSAVRSITGINVRVVISAEHTVSSTQAITIKAVIGHIAFT